MSEKLMFKLGKKTIVQYHHFEIKECTDENRNKIVEIGRRLIVNDEDALFNYAVNQGLLNYLNSEECKAHLAYDKNATMKTKYQPKLVKPKKTKISKKNK